MIGPANTADRIAFDSEALPPSERFAAYRDLYAGGATATEDGPCFRARLRAWRLDRAVLYDRRVSDVIHERGESRVADDGFNHFTVTFVLLGSYEIDIGRGWRRLGEREALLLDTRRPMRNRTRDAHIITVSMARERVLGVSDGDAPLHGHVLGAARAAPLGALLETLPPLLDTMSAERRAAAAAAIVALLAVGLEGRAEAVADESAEAARVARLRRLIDARLTDPDFSIEALAAESGLSRATLYRSFRDAGGIAGVIQGRRVEYVRRMLAGADERRSFAEIALAAGFASESHASRLFHERFGMRPGEYRRAATRAEQGPDPTMQMRLWVDEVA